MHLVTYFSDVPPTERLRYLKAVKGIEIDVGEAIFNIGDAADAFYCVMYGSLNVVMDFAHMAAPTLNEFEEILNRARVHSSLLNPGGITGHGNVRFFLLFLIWVLIEKNLRGSVRYYCC